MIKIRMTGPERDRCAIVTEAGSVSGAHLAASLDAALVRYDAGNLRSIRLTLRGAWGPITILTLDRADTPADLPPSVRMEGTTRQAWNAMQRAAFGREVEILATRAAHDLTVEEAAR